MAVEGSTQWALRAVAQALAGGTGTATYGRLPAVRKGTRLHLLSHTPWYGKAYDVAGVVEVTPRTVRSGAVMIRLRVEQGEELGPKGRRSLAGKSVWLPWSPAYVQARAV